MITALDHIAVAVPDLQKAIARFCEDFGLDLGGTEDVVEFFCEGFEIAAIGGGGYFSVDVHSLAVGGDVGFGDKRRKAEVYYGVGGLFDGFVLEFFYGFGEQAAVHFVADGVYVAALFGAEDVASAANFKIP